MASPVLSRFDTLQELLLDLFSSEPVTDITLKPSNSQGLGGGSASSSEKATVTMSNGHPDVNIFVKVCRKGSMAENFNRMLHTFDKEIYFYRDIYPRMLAQQELHGGTPSEFDLRGFVPKCYGVAYVAEDLCIVLEDFLATAGYEVTTKEAFMSVEQIGLCLSSLAVLHAVSRSMEGIEWSRKVELFDHINSEGNEPFMRPFFCDQLAHFLDMMLALQEQKDAGDELLHSLVIHPAVTRDVLLRLKGMSPKMLRVFRLSRSPPEGPVGVLCHGDFHMWNVAFDNSEGSLRLKLFDFQAINYSSFACDLHHFLSQTCTPKVRHEHLSGFLATYSASFLSTCKSLGAPDPGATFSPEGVAKEYAERSAIGYLFGLCFILPRFVTDQKRFDAVKHMIDSAEIVRGLDKCSEKMWDVFQMYFDIVSEHLELGTLERMERLLCP